MKKWFDQILSGAKKEEYREIKPYWEKRLDGQLYDQISFRNGYATDAPEMMVEYLGMHRSTFQGVPVFALRLGKIISTKNVQPKNNFIRSSLRVNGPFR